MTLLEQPKQSALLVLALLVLVQLYNLSLLGNLAEAA